MDNQTDRTENQGQKQILTYVDTSMRKGKCIQIVLPQPIFNIEK